MYGLLTLRGRKVMNIFTQSLKYRYEQLVLKVCYFSSFLNKLF